MKTLDTSLAAIVDFTLERRCGKLSPTTTDAVTRSLVDTMGCALGGLSSGPATLARSLIEDYPRTDGCAVLGSRSRAAPEDATFANTIAVRYLDFNDHYPGSGHPSDMIPAILAAGELSRTSGEDLVRAIDIAYEVATAIGDNYPFRLAGFDQGVLDSAGVAASCGALLGLDAAALAHAISIAVTSTMPLRVTRAGALSNWKGCATSLVARNGLHAVRLSARGLTGPDRPFQGIDGLDRQVPPRAPLKLGVPQRGGLAAIQRTNTKLYPTEANAQEILHTLLAMSAEVGDPGGIAAVDIETYHRAWHEIGGGQGDQREKWDPSSRETADHSLPYLAAVALVDRVITLDSLDPSRIADPALRPVMGKITVTEAPDLTALHPEVLRSRITVTLSDGRTLRRQTSVRPGTWQRPMTRDELRAKAESLAHRTQRPEYALALLEVAWRLDELESVTQLTNLFGEVVV